MMTAFLHHNRFFSATEAIWTAKSSSGRAASSLSRGVSPMAWYGASLARCSELCAIGSVPAALTGLVVGREERGNASPFRSWRVVSSSVIDAHNADGSRCSRYALDHSDSSPISATWRPMEGIAFILPAGSTAKPARILHTPPSLFAARTSDAVGQPVCRAHQPWMPADSTLMMPIHLASSQAGQIRCCYSGCLLVLVRVAKTILRARKRLQIHPSK